MNVTYIYLVENCYGDSNKVYIGKTKHNRKSQHQKTYGKNISYTIIDEVNSILRKDWKPLETYWIWQFRTWGFETMNGNDGGGGPNIYSPEVLERMSKSKRGIPKPKGFGKKLSKILKGKPNLKNRKPNIKNKCLKPTLHIPILQKSKDGKIIKEWTCQEEIKRELKHLKGIKGINEVLRKRNKNQNNFSCAGFVWEYKNK